MYDANSTARIQRLFDKKIIPLAHNVSSFDIKYSTATGRSFLSAFASDFACELTPFAPTLTTFLAATTIVVIVPAIKIATADIPTRFSKFFKSFKCRIVARG